MTSIAKRLRTDQLPVEVRVAVSISPATVVLEAGPIADLVTLITFGIGRVGRFSWFTVSGNGCPAA
jgi:hypothetical protein